MLPKWLYILFIVHTAVGRIDFGTKPFLQDSAIIIDVDKTILLGADSDDDDDDQSDKMATDSISDSYDSGVYQQIPYQHDRIRLNRRKKPKTTYRTTTTTTTTTTTEMPTTNTAINSSSSSSINTTTINDSIIINTTTAAPAFIIPPDIDRSEYPNDLLDIAQQRLGIRNFDEIPSIRELGEILGTDNPYDTVQKIRKLTANEKGIELIKNLIESADYTDNVRESADKNKQDEMVPTDTIEISNEIIPIGFFERIYLDIYNWLPHLKERLIETTKCLYTRREAPDTPPPSPRSPVAVESVATEKSLLMHKPMPPYHFPIPLRYSDTNRSPSTKVHLNTNRKQFPSYIQLAKIINVEPKKLQTFLQNKPKLAALAARVSAFPLTHDKAALMSTQVIAALQRIVAEDEDLQRLLNSTMATLK